MTLVTAVGAALADDGALAGAVEGFRAREPQQRMAAAVAEAIERQTALIVEAGTGTGKTFAYLVPALLSGRRVMVSTGTRTLQDQLYHRDLPMVARALERPLNAALLKGRSNYLCLYRMERAREDGRFESREQSAAFQRVVEWSGLTRRGDLAEAPLAAGDPGLTARITSTAENCLGAECPLHAECFLMQARRRAQEADVVVVNHHLLMADWAVRDGGYGEVLPRADVHVLDEAHQLPDTAAQFFGLALSGRQMQDLVRDCELEQIREAPDSPEIADAAAHLRSAAREFRLALGESGRRAAWSEISAQTGVGEAVADLQAALETLRACLEPQAVRGKGLESCWRRSTEQQQALARFMAGEGEDSVQWFETQGQGFGLRLTPLVIGEAFRSRMDRQAASWIFTSATLAVDGRFEHYCGRLGLEDAATLQVESPFDYRRNALLYVPPAMPEPGDFDFTERFLAVAEQVMAASGGRAFLLFTSHRALTFAARRLRERSPFPLFVQGEAGQNQLLERFREAGNAVLLGTQSFWEGVDVRGEALGCVMIDRLPFASPGDPVVRARIAALKRQHGNPFFDYQVPQAVIALRQGVGRLIRDSTDRGVLVIGDGRLVTKSYGRLFRHSLPPMPLSRSLEDVVAFFATEDAAS